MNYIQEIIRLAANDEYQKEVASIAVASMKTIDKLREEENKDHLTTAITSVVSGILQPSIGHIASKADGHSGILTYEIRLSDYASDTLNGWYISLEDAQRAIAGLRGKVEGQATTKDERQKFKVELLEKLNTILTPVTVLDVGIIPIYWLDDEPSIDPHRIAISLALNFTDDIVISQNSETGDIRIVDDEHIQ